MFVQVTAQDELRVGEAAVLLGNSPSGHFAAMFEDDGETGYFYALDMSLPDQRIVDALHIYNVAQVSDRHRPSIFKVGWSANGQSAVLLVNEHPHAVFDFRSKAGCCRSGFPAVSADSVWSSHGHAWREEALAVFSRSEH